MVGSSQMGKNAGGVHLLQLHKNVKLSKEMGNRE